MILEDLTYKIIGCAMAVQNVLHNGFPEIIYQRALSMELNLQGLSFDLERPVAVYYKGEIVGYRRADFFIEEKVLVEVKAVGKIEASHVAQALNYVNAYKLPVALLINFGAPSLEYKRLHPK